jgi:hypothetical protein
LERRFQPSAEDIERDPPTRLAAFVLAGVTDALAIVTTVVAACS